MTINDIVLPIAKAEERWGPKPGRWRDQIPSHTNRIPSTYERPTYEDKRPQLPLESPDLLPIWERPEPKPEKGYEHSYDDGMMIIIRGPDEIYRRGTE